MKRLNKVLVFLLCLALPCVCIGEADDPVIVRVGGVEYPLSYAQYSYQSNLDVMAYQGYVPAEEEKAELKRQTIDHMVELALIENKLTEAGRNDLSEEEETLLRVYAGNVYESLWQGFRQRAAQEGYEPTEQQVTEWLTQEGYTLDMVYLEALIEVRNERILDLYCSDVTVSPEETEAYYREYFLGPDREAYEHDIPRYEREILTPGNEAFYTPEGYRVVRQILLPFPDQVVSSLNALAPSIEEKATELDAAYGAAADAAIAGDGVEEARENYLAVLAEYGALLDQVSETEESALPLVKDTTDEILQRYRQGETFDSLIAAFAQEAGSEAGGELLFHAESENWPEAFRRAAMALQKPGDVSEPFVTGLGIHILLYQEDYPGGVHPLTEQEQQALEASALQNRQMEKLHGLMEEWKDAYQIETYPELFVTAQP